MRRRAERTEEPLAVHTCTAVHTGIEFDMVDSVVVHVDSYNTDYCTATANTCCLDVA